MKGLLTFVAGVLLVATVVVTGSMTAMGRTPSDLTFVGPGPTTTAPVVVLSVEQQLIDTCNRSHAVIDRALEEQCGQLIDQVKAKGETVEFRMDQFDVRDVAR
jgi:hypothetical protein